MPRERAKERAYDRYIRETLAYRAIFKYPLSHYQLWTYLISDKRVTYGFFLKELQKLAKKNYIGLKDGKYFHRGIKPVSWDLRVKTSKELLEQNMPLFTLLGSIPWVRLICITGSVAAFNADKNADIDMFVVCAKNRMWLTRGFVGLLLKTAKMYVTRDSDPGKVCPNLFIDETNLEWAKAKQNVYTAHEIAMMQPVINKNDTYFKFLSANKWVLNYFPNLLLNFDGLTSAKEPKSAPVNLLEKIAMLSQLRYMQAKKTTEVTTKHLVHFNKNDNADKILSYYAQLLSKL